MDQPQTVTHSAMRGINRSAILETVRRRGPISRSQIAATLDISLPTVMRIVDELIDEGFVRPQGATEWSGGRRRSLLEFHVDGQVVIGVDLGGAQLFGAVADLGGNVLGEVDMPRHGTSGKESYDRVVELIETLLASPTVAGRRVRGIGVGAPGVTRHREGIVTWAYALDWKDFPLKARLAERFQLPITVDNDVNLAALGELWFGAGQNVQNMVLLAIGTGIGAGIIIDRALYRGSHEASGEIGHMIPGRDFLGRNCVAFGALEGAASGTGIAGRARQVLDGTRSPDDLAGLLADDVFDAARQGQDWAQRVIDETVDYLAIAVANISVAFDPEIIVLGGSVTRSADLLVAPILRRLNGCLPSQPQLVVSSLGRRAAAMGAIVNVLHNTADFYLLRKLS
jgi:glucokinase-like ROK family protein